MQVPDSAIPAAPHDRPVRGLPVVLVILAIALLQFAYWSATSVGGPRTDQSLILEQAQLYADTGVLRASAKRTSGGGKVPGGLMIWSIGSSLRLWSDHRAPVALIALANALALLLTWFTVRRMAGPRVGFWFLALYGLTPWRLFYGGMLWEPAFLVLPCAVHLAACAALRNKAGWPASVALGGSVTVAFQFHASFIVLAIAAALLWLQRRIRPNLPAVVLGAALGAMPFVLSLLVATNEGVLDFAPSHSKGLLDTVRTSLGNIPKGFLYFLRMGSADIGGRYGETDLAPALVGVLRALATISVLLPGAALFEAWRSLGWKAPLSPRRDGEDDPTQWLLHYSLAMLAALLLGLAMSPVTVQSWHTAIALPAACIPAAMLLPQLWDRGRLGRACVLAWFAILLAGGIAILAGHPLSTGVEH